MPYCCRHMPARQHTAKKSRGEAPVRQKGKNRPPLAIPPGDRTRTRAAPRKVESFRRAIQEKTRPVPCRELRERPFSATPPCGKKRFRDGQEPPADWPPKTAPEDCPRRLSRDAGREKADRVTGKAPGKTGRGGIGIPHGGSSPATRTRALPSNIFV